VGQRTAGHVEVNARRGDVLIVDLGDAVGREQAGVRPALVVSSDVVNDGPAGLVIVVPLTRTRRSLPSHIEIEPGESGLDHVSYAKTEDLRSVSTDRVMTRLGRASPAVMFETSRAMRYLLEL
jgi:mRNA interferase MazF